MIDERMEMRMRQAWGEFLGKWTGLTNGVIGKEREKVLWYCLSLTRLS